MEKWRISLPKEPTLVNCLVTMQPSGRKTRYVAMGWVDESHIMPGGIAWMPLPQHISDSPNGWFSPYRGDDYPTKNGWYLVCFEKQKWLIKSLYFDVKKNEFLGAPRLNSNAGCIIGWRSLPKPYTGLGWPRE